MEQVLVVLREELERILPQEVFITREMPEILAFILEHHHFALRDTAEYDRSLKQIIPYAIIRQKERFFLLRRLNKQREIRLHDRLSLGIGGHLNPTDIQEHGSIIEAGMHRELAEEMFVEEITTMQCVGILNDDTGGVSDFHLGVVYLLDSKGQVQVRETEKMEGSWVTLEELRMRFDQLETWSQIIAREMLGMKL